VTYPYGWHLQDESNGKGTMVFVVNTIGDVAKARRMLEAVFPAEHLCVRKATWSAKQMSAAVHELENSAEAVRLHVAADDKDPANDRVTAKVLIMDEAVAGYLHRAAGGRIVPVPVLRKVR
jgi:hypothetical protein